VEHPPGLYASWNYGINQITSEFCYISSVGDSITREGIDHLATAASRLNCDVLVSRPDFVNEAGQPYKGPEWPMDGVIQRLELREPVRLSSAIIIATALTHTWCAITGSCASDLFRTAMLQKHPFPLNFGTAGDGAWSLQNAVRVHWATTPEKVTTFRFHPTMASATEVKAAQTSNQFAQMARKAVSEWIESDCCDASAEVREDIIRLLSFSIEYDQCRRQYNILRIGKWPWILNPTAWLARTRRNQIKSEVCSLMQKICRSRPALWWTTTKV
jgi:hypothetical protein